MRFSRAWSKTPGSNTSSWLVLGRLQKVRLSDDASLAMAAMALYKTLRLLVFEKFQGRVNDLLA